MRAVANPHELLDAEIIRARATITDADLAAQRPLIVVVGGRASNYPRWMHADPRIAIWTDMTNRTPTLPATTCVVVSSPFVSHAQSRAVETSAFHKPGCYYFKHPRTLAEIRRIVQVLLDVAIPDDDTAYEPAPRPMNAPRLTIVDAPARDRVAPNALQRVDPPALTRPPLTRSSARHGPRRRRRRRRRRRPSRATTSTPRSAWSAKRWLRCRW
jgi:hypothetical protein